MAEWTKERTEQLRKLHCDGYSAGKIAEVFGDVSRNAVIGKLSRMGLVRRDSIRKLKSGRPANLPIAPTRRQERSFRGKRTLAGLLATAPKLKDVARAMREVAGLPWVPTVPLPAEPVLVQTTVTFAELELHHCRWPYGDPRSPDFRFCGAPRIEGSSYCKACHSKSYVSARKVNVPFKEREREAA